MPTRRDSSIEAYKAKRDLSVTPEPPGRRARQSAKSPMFVVQKHQAHRAGLHWDFRLEHGGVLWSWAVRKGPSLDPADKRIAAHVEDHPVDYANFEGVIPDGQYGAGKVEIWDKGTWTPLVDPDAGIAAGEIKFVLNGTRLHGRFTLVRLRPRSGRHERGDNWLLIKGHDEWEKPGADAATLEAMPLSAGGGDEPETKGAAKGTLPLQQDPQLAVVAEEPPDGDAWLSEIKFDGYRILAFLEDGGARLMTRNRHDWTHRLPSVCEALRRVPVKSALLDGELVALDERGVSSFPALQAALASGHDANLVFFVFDLLHLNGWDLRGCQLIDRKNRLQNLAPWDGRVRYSDHHLGETARMRQAACRMQAEGIICKKADAPYRPGRSSDWLKVKCLGREEFIILGWTDPNGLRSGFGSLHVGYYDRQGRLQYAGGVGTGFSDELLENLRQQVGTLKGPPAGTVLLSGEDFAPGIHWVPPILVAEVSYTAWSGAGRIRHAVFLGLREDKDAAEVIRDAADPDAPRRMVRLPRQTDGSRRARTIIVPAQQPSPPSGSRRVVTARSPASRTETVAGIELTHPNKPLWPGITKRDLGEYWVAVADHALPGLVKRPMAILRCPEGIEGEHFFQKHSHGMFPSIIREQMADKAPYIAIDGLEGLITLVQFSAVELHVWGASEAHPMKADQLVFDLDPGEGVQWPDVIAAALEVRKKLEGLGLPAFCRTSGGKGLHIVVPVIPSEPWDTVRTFCHAFASLLSEQSPEKYLAHVKIADRKGRILVDWLRNGLGSTAVASFCPRARPGAQVATPLSWKEVRRDLDPAAFTVHTVPERLKRLRVDPWENFDASRVRLPKLPMPESKPVKAKANPRSRSRIVTAKPPRPRPDA